MGWFQKAGTNSVFGASSVGCWHRFEDYRDLYSCGKVWGVVFLRYKEVFKAIVKAIPSLISWCRSFGCVFTAMGGDVMSERNDRVRRVTNPDHLWTAQFAFTVCGVDQSGVIRASDVVEFKHARTRLQRFDGKLCCKYWDAVGVSNFVSLLKDGGGCAMTDFKP